jgi:hypothetical protein
MFLRVALFVLLASVAAGAQDKSNKTSRTNSESAVSIEVFQVLDLPLTVHEASLVKSERAYVVKLAAGNSSEEKLVGLRYSLVTIDSKNQMQLLVNRNEGCLVPAYASRTLIFKTPIRLKLKGGERLVLMVEQVMSPEWIWDVLKAKDALEAYTRGDYSVMPGVMKMLNQVDAPDVPRVIYRPQRNEED